MARLISQLDAAAAVDTANDLLWIEQSGVPKKITPANLGTGGGSGRLTETQAITTSGWYRIATNSSASGRGSATFYLSSSGGGAAPQQVMFRVQKSYGGGTATDMMINVLSNLKHAGNSVQQLRIVYDTTLSEVHVEAFLGVSSSSTFNVSISPDNVTGDSWATVDFTAGNAEEFDLTWDLSTGNAMTGWRTDNEYAFTKATGELVLSSGIQLVGTINFDDAVGDKGLWYGAGGGANSYVTGVEGNTLYHRSATYHRWYIGSVADAGVSDYMELSSTKLQVNADIELTGNLIIPNGVYQQFEDALDVPQNMITLWTNGDFYVGAATIDNIFRGLTNTFQGNSTFQNSLTSTGLLTASAGLNVTGAITGTTEVSAPYIGVENTTGSNGYGLSLYGGAQSSRPTYGIMFQQTATFGTYGQYVTGDWATYFTMSNTAGRGWIWSNTSGVNVAGMSKDGDFQINGNFKQVNRGIVQQHSSQGGFIAGSPGGAQIKAAGTSSMTGAIEIGFPTAAYASDDMVTLWVDIYDYSTGESVTLYLGGYLYQAVGLNEWVNCTAITLSERTDRDYTVRFGVDVGGTRHKIWIGETTSTWSHLQVTVRDVSAGYTADIDAYDDGWALALVTTLGTVDETITSGYPATNATKVAAGNLASGVLPYAAAAGASAYKLALLNTTGTAAGNFGLLNSGSGVSYNPGTETLSAVNASFDDATIPILSVQDTLSLGSTPVTTTGAITSPSFTSGTNATQPWLTLDSASTGDSWTSQGAGISVGESGKKGSAAIHMTYNGDGSGYIGMGAVDDTAATGGRPAWGHIDFQYNTNEIKFGGRIYPGIAVANTTTDSNVQSTAYIEDASAQNYGSINVSGIRGTSGTYSGISVNRRFVMMNNGSTTSGLYNDTNNQWFLACVENSYTGQYYAGNLETRTINSDAAGNTSGMEVKDHAQLYRDVGFNDLRRVADNVASVNPVQEQHMGGVIYADDNTAFTITLTTSGSQNDWPVGGVITIINANTTTSLTISDNTNYTCFYMDPANGRVDIAGSATLAAGGVATIWRAESGGVSTTPCFIMWGSGITA